MNNIKISVAMTTFNGESFLVEQIDSILNQSMKVDEIIISDDGSNDNTLTILQDYSAQYPIIKILSAETQGIGANNNFIRAFDHCSGELILPCDQDDIWFPNKVEVLFNALNDNVDLVYAQDIIIDEKGNTFEDVWYIENPKQSIYKNKLKGHTCIFRKKLIELYAYSGCMSWDYVLSMYVFVTGRGLGLPDYLMYWRRHKGALTYVTPMDLTNQANNLQEKKKKSKWDESKKTISAILKGKKSDQIRCHMQSRSNYIAFLLSISNCKDSTKREWRIISRIAALISHQTVPSMISAGIMSSYLYLLEGRVGSLLFAFRTPFNEWWAIHDQKYLG